MGYCPICGEKINEVLLRSCDETPYHLEKREGMKHLSPRYEIRPSWSEYLCPECREVITNDQGVAIKVLQMSQLEAKSFNVLRKDSPEEYVESTE